MILHAKQEETQTENKCMGTKGEKGKWDELGDTYTLLCIKQLTHEKLLHSTGSSPQCSVETYMRVWANSGREWGREAWRAAVHGVTKSWTQLSNWIMTANGKEIQKEEMHVYLWLIHFAAQQKPTQWHIATRLQFLKAKTICQLKTDTFHSPL